MTVLCLQFNKAEIIQVGDFYVKRHPVFADKIVVMVNEKVEILPFEKHKKIAIGDVTLWRHLLKPNKIVIKADRSVNIRRIKKEDFQ